MVKKLQKHCTLCGDLDYNLDKIRNGIFLKEKFICGQCQREIVSSNVINEEYFFFKEQIRNIIFN